MRDRKVGFSRGLGVGLVVGAIVGLVLADPMAALGGIGKAGWERFSVDFKQGYIAGFVDFARIGIAMEPKGYLATTYVVPPKARLHQWRLTVDELYANKENAARPLMQLLVIAGHKLAAEFGYTPLRTRDHRVDGLRRVLDARQRATREAAAREAKAGEEPGEDPVKEKAGTADEPLAPKNGEQAAANAASNDPASDDPAGDKPSSEGVSGDGEQSAAKHAAQ